MNRLRHLLVVLVAALAALATTGALSPAQAAGGGWQPAGEMFTATAGWVRLGHIRGVPGNASSGYLYFNTDESGPTPLLEQYDWTCPAGVTPPTVLDTTPCTLLRDRFLTPVSGGAIRFTGPVSARLTGVFATDPGSSRSVESVDVSFRPTGPVSRSVSQDADSRTVTLSAPMRMTGHVGRDAFGDPAVSSSVSGWIRTFYFTR